MNYDMIRTKDNIYSPERYMELYQNQVKANTIYCNLIFNLRNNQALILKELRQYLNLDNDFDLILGIDSIYSQFALIGINCEIVVYLDIVIKIDKKVISKNEQLFFYIYNETIELDVI